MEDLKNDGYGDLCSLPPAYNMLKHKPSRKPYLQILQFPLLLAVRESVTDSKNVLFLYAWAFIGMRELFC